MRDILSPVACSVTGARAHTHTRPWLYVLTGVTSDSRYSCYIWRSVTELHLTLQLPLSPDFPAAAVASRSGVQHVKKRMTNVAGVKTMSTSNTRDALLTSSHRPPPVTTVPHVRTFPPHSGILPSFPEGVKALLFANQWLLLPWPNTIDPRTDKCWVLERFQQLHSQQTVYIHTQRPIV